MPMAPPRQCPVPGCAGTLPCPTHQRVKPNGPRRSAGQRGYDAMWRGLRDRWLREHPSCVRCGQPADMVDHIVALVDGGARLDRANLASMCWSCHSDKTQSERRARAARFAARRSPR